MKLDIIEVGLVSIRIAPVLIAGHFALQSILNQDPGGMLYLTGLMFTAFIAYLFKDIMPDMNINVGDPKYLICRSIGVEPFNNMSLSQIVLNFTLGYLSIAVCMHGNKCADRWQPIAFFVFLIISNYIFEQYNGCLKLTALLLSGFIGLIGGMSWAGIIKGAGYRNLPLFGGINDKITCAKAQSNIVCKRPT